MLCACLGGHEEGWAELSLPGHSRALGSQAELPGIEPAQLPFPTMLFDESRYKVFGVVTNTIPVKYHSELEGEMARKASFPAALLDS